ncbi:MAG TPA: phosphoribosyltransferase family protein [Myxococcota bacterium]|nr:phosphoribosyltransferase family protein [Myxococcota bacterium]
MRAVRRALFELLVPSVCPACDAPRAPGDTLLCGPCAGGVRRLSRLRAVHTAIAYEGTGLELLRRFKFEHRHDARELLLHWLVERLQSVRFDAIVPLPRHLARVRSEGADPVHELARGLARATGARLCGRALWRAHATPPQTGLSLAARRANVAGSFAARAGALRGRRVLLLDDVATTGATLAEAARTLRRAGATRIALAAAAGTLAMETRSAPVL